MRNTDHIILEDRAVPLLLPWPLPGDPGGFIEVAKADDWRALVGSLGIDPRIPDIVRAKFHRAHTLYLVGWLDLGLVKAAELAALIALELAVMDRYGGKVSKSKRSFAALLKYMVDSDGLTDAQIPMIVRCGGKAIGQLTGDTRPTLAERRNKLAHGDPFDGLPTGGLLELVRDLINFAYRDYIAAAASLEVQS
ncbi:hypothetical protein [Novosphingobium pentaromativorans]|uniref:Uncharacterized protein n=1 Tax=Novosphingobium pentaromativorans US6-1 TaxID=1088721 RepID=G6EKX2_9SPHN|nr:hypothetical protein [Novosphingobium pentaromativorans]AIT82742.1 hypothetical protein JI59_25175 [Novosphingobium pentaromativorans US6-1]EHJ57939.1 hypothetical protein NSU_pLA1045 [Novosphingobium pentaromativorans US6-1]